MANDKIQKKGLDATSEPAMLSSSVTRISKRACEIMKEKAHN